MAVLVLTAFLLSSLVLRVEVEAVGEYDPSGRIYPWPLPADRKPLFFGLIVSFGETFNSSGVVPGVNVALDIINSNGSNLLPGYSLHYVLSDSQCSRTTALDVFFEQILSETEYQKLAVIGAGCSLATEPTAEISHQFNITQLSCASTSPALSDRSRFRKYFQLLPSMADVIYSYIGVFKHFRWRKVVMIVQEENLFTEMVRNLKEQLASNNISLVEYTFSTDIGLSDLQIKPFTNESERIYLIATFENYARALLCNAFHLGIRYPTHLLLTFQWYDERWWLEDNDVSDVNLTCSGEERESVLRYSLAFNFILVDLLNDKNITTNVGMIITGEEYIDRERQYIGTAPHYFNRLPCAQYCFDATLALAYALNETMTDIMSSEINSRLASLYDVSSGAFGLEHFNYGNDALTNITFDHLQNTSFNGITGKVSLNSNGVRTADYLTVHQFREVDGGGLNWVRIGVFARQKDSEGYVLDTNLSNGTLSAVWPSGVPFDGMPNERIATANIALVVVIDVFAAAGLTFAVVCLTFNFIFRNKRLIRLSSPKLNNIMVLGTIILYLAIVLFAIPTPSLKVITGLCVARLWFLSLGVSLAFGTIIMKMFRVYIIFRNPTPKRKRFINDWTLALFVLILVVLDLVVLVSFTAIVGGLNISIVDRVPHKENPQDIEGDVRNVTNNFIHICRSTPERVAVGVAFVYKGLLQLAAFVLAIHTQRVKVKGLNDAKYIIAAVYASSIGLILATLTHFFAIENENLHAALFAASTFFSSTAILGLIFIPKMVELRKDPDGERVFAHSHSQGEEVSLGNKGTVQLQKEMQLSTSTENTLRQRIKQLEDILSSYSGGGKSTNNVATSTVASRGDVNTSSSGNIESDREVQEHVSSLEVVD